MNKSNKVFFRASLLFNVVFIFTIAFLLMVLLVRDFQYSEQMDSRPKGAIVRLDRDYTLVSDTAPSFVLPAGTMLQESTPHGAATLGKMSGREYLLIITTEDYDFTTNSQWDREETWAAPYTFVLEHNQ